MDTNRNLSNQLPGIDILYNTTFQILSRTEFKGKNTNEITAEMGQLKMAYEQAKQLFRGEFRRDGKRYFEHLRSVTDIVLKELPHPTLKKVIVAMLHDMLEDTEVDFETLKNLFGEEIAIAVDLLTKKSIDHYLPDGEEKTYVQSLNAEEKESYYQQHKERLNPIKEAGYYNRLFDSRNDLAISVKVADRMHNLRDMLGASSSKKIQEYINETSQYIIPGLESFDDTYVIGITHLDAYLANLKVYLQSLKTGKELEEALKA